MPISYVRVRNDTAEFSIVESALHHYEDCEVLRDKPAANATGDPLPPKTIRQRAASPASSPASSQTSSAKGRKASTDTEE